MRYKSRIFLFLIATGFLPLLVVYEGCSGVGAAMKTGNVDAAAAPVSPTMMVAFETTFYSFAKTQGCVQCHGGTMHPAFANPDITTAYAEAKGSQIGSSQPLIDFTNPMNSIYVTYAGNAHCGVAACSNPAVDPQVQSLLATWAKAELTGSSNTPPPTAAPQISTYLTSSQPIPANLPDLTSANPAVVRFDLSKMTPALPQLANAVLEVQIQLTTPTEYRVSNLRLAGNTVALNLTGIHVFVNTAGATGPGTEQAVTGTLWNTLTLMAPVTSLPSPLPTGPMTTITALTKTVLEIQMQSATDVMTIGIDSIQPTTPTPAPSPSPSP